VVCPVPSLAVPAAVRIPEVALEVHPPAVVLPARWAVVKRAAVQVKRDQGGNRAAKVAGAKWGAERRAVALKALAVSPVAQVHRVMRARH
jgi:hypothetical protein